MNQSAEPQVWGNTRNPDWNEILIQQFKGRPVKRVHADSEYLTFEIDGAVAVVQQYQVAPHKVWFDSAEVHNLGELMSIEPIRCAASGKDPVRGEYHSKITGTAGNVIIIARKEHDGSDSDVRSFRFDVEVASV